MITSVHLQDKELWAKQVVLAREVMSEVHAGQTRKMGEDKGKPYEVHTLRVGDSFEDDILRAAGYLHDSIEDYPLGQQRGFEYLVDRGVDPFIVKIVGQLTKLDGETYFEFIMRVMQGLTESIKVKLADLRDNLKGSPPGSRSDKYRLAIFILSEELHRRELADKLKG